MKLLAAILTSILASVRASSDLQYAGASLSVNEHDYFISPYVEATVGYNSNHGVFGFRPISVVPRSALNATSSLFEAWSATDDVFADSFAEYVISAHSLPQDLPLGPYFMSHTGTLHRAYRLYADEFGAFSQALFLGPDGNYQPVSAQVSSAPPYLTIGVPSRIYSFSPTDGLSAPPDKPLAGLRLGVKDIFSLRGARTSNGNRAWHSLYPPSNTTAPSVQRLVDAGAVVVGLQVTAQFASGEAATADWVDYHAPFNPRGDGYDNPASSTAGGASSLAGYEWMDLAIGTDTGGSLRTPAAVQGLFGGRPTWGISDLEGVLPMAPALDTVGLLARDPEVWHKANGVLYDDGYDVSGDDAEPLHGFPSSVLTMDYPEMAETAADEVLLEFAEKLSMYLGGTHGPFDIVESWDQDTPAAANSAGLDEYLNFTYAIITGKEQAELVRDPFFADYAAAHDGRTPFINPVPLMRWEYGTNFSDSDLAREHEHMSVFHDWFEAAVFLPRVPSSSPDAGSSCTSSPSLIIRPVAAAEPFWRNEYFPDDGGPPLGYNPSRAATLAGLPEAVFPVGQAPAMSIVTGVEEMWPVAVGIMAARGCDAMLGRLAIALVKEGILKVPGTGSVTFEEGYPGHA